MQMQRADKQLSYLEIRVSDASTLLISYSLLDPRSEHKYVQKSEHWFWFWLKYSHSYTWDLGKLKGINKRKNEVQHPSPVFILHRLHDDKHPPSPHLLPAYKEAGRNGNKSGFMS